MHDKSKAPCRALISTFQELFGTRKRPGITFAFRDFVLMLQAPQGFTKSAAFVSAQGEPGRNLLGFQRAVVRRLEQFKDTVAEAGF